MSRFSKVSHLTGLRLSCSLRAELRKVSILKDPLELLNYLNNKIPGPLGLRLVKKSPREFWSQEIKGGELFSGLKTILSF